MTRAADVAVVGGGVIGLAAADSLATNGVDVRCFEPAAPGSGQSAGLTRVFRHIHDTPELVRLAHVARRGWDAWSDRAGEQLVGREGVLFAAPSVEAEAALLADAGLEHRLVDENEQRELLPALDPPAPMALFDAGGGAIRVRPTIDSLVAALGDRLVREEVLALQAEDDNGGATLFTSEGLWRSDRVLVCAGVRTAELARASGLELSVDTSLHVRVTFAVRPEHRGAALACWYDRTRRHGPGVYAGPLAPDRYVVGVGTDDQGGDDPGIDAASRYVERVLPGLDPQPVAHRPCWLTMLPWHADAFAVWAAGPLLFFGGHNLFKFAPVLGALLARAATTGQIPAELTPPR